MIEQIRKELMAMQDLEYRNFHAKLMPTVSKEVIIGVRTPQLRKYAKDLLKMAKTDKSVENGLHNFMSGLPHKYYEENNLHGFLIEGIKDYHECLAELNKFIPYIDNWATCDLVNPKVLKKYPQQLLEQIRIWMDSDKTYTIRYGIGVLMRYYLDDLFEEKYLEWVIEKQSEEYYVNMMIAWFLATALAKQYDKAIPVIENKRLEAWTHNKTIQKAIESNRVSNEHKEYLRKLKISD